MTAFAHFTGSKHSDVLIVGGGVIGLACAHYLAQEGRSVRIVEQETIGSGASGGNCGLLFISDLLPLVTPGAVFKQLGEAFRKHSPLTIKPRLDFGLACWLLRFAAGGAFRHPDRAIRARSDLLGVSGTLYAQLAKGEKLDCDHDQAGVLLAFIDAKTMAAYGKLNRSLEPFGVAATFLDQRSVRQFEPALKETVCGGWYHPKDSHLRPERFVAAWAGRLRENQNVSLVEGCRFTSFEIDRGKVVRARTTKGRFSADRFVLATGVWTPLLGKQLGLSIPIQPAKGYSITTDRPPSCPKVPCYLYERRVVATPWASGFRLGGTLEFSGLNTHLDEQRLAELTASAALYLKTPRGARILERWTAMRPMCVDDLPLIDRVPTLANLCIAAGHGILGLTAATGTGRLIADLVLERRPIFDPAPFSIKRFG